MPGWVYIEREQYVRMCEKVEVSEETKESIKSWAISVSLKSETPRLKRVFISPNNKFQAWSAGIPNPDIRKGKSGGYRVIFFVNLQDSTINLDYIEIRKNLGFKGEGHKRKSKYNSYIQDLKKYLKALEGE